MAETVLLGNEAIGFALASEGLGVMSAYPGTPSSEILPSVVKYAKTNKLSLHTEWSVNEKIALDHALAGAMVGLRSAVAMKQVGLNVAADSLMSAAYMGVIGGMIIVTADDPGPHSSQTEQDTRMMAFLAKVPVLDPSTPKEAMEMIKDGFELSEKYQIPIILRPGIRICHAKQSLETPEPKRVDHKPEFKREPGRWAATPKFRFVQHKQINEKLDKIAEENNSSRFNKLSFETDRSKKYPLGVLTGGAPAAALLDILKEEGIFDDIPVLQLGAPFPFPTKLVDSFLDNCEKVLVVEETDLFIELFANQREKLIGRMNKVIPGEGELTPEVIRESLSKAMDMAGLKPLNAKPANEYNKLIPELNLPVRKPRLCSGCGHRAAFYSIRKAYPKAIFPSDIGCYTLGLNLRAVDTVLDMGAGITLASGLYQAMSVGDNESPPIIGTMGDSTFYHSGTSSLINAIYNKAKMVLVLLDNSITAMTGMQPTPDLGTLADGTLGNRIPLADLIRGCGVKHLSEVDSYDIPNLINAVKEAHEYARSPEGSVAVVIARHPCRIAQPKQDINPVTVNDNCDGCSICVGTFECPAMDVPQKGEKVVLDPKLCVHCGVCVHVCPNEALEVAK